MKVKDKTGLRAIALAQALNGGENPLRAVIAAGYKLDQVSGRDLGSEAMEIEEPGNDYIDLGWTRGQHHAVRLFDGKWCVEILRRLDDQGEDLP